MASGVGTSAASEGVGSQRAEITDEQREHAEANRRAAVLIWEARVRASAGAGGGAGVSTAEDVSTAGMDGTSGGGSGGSGGDASCLGVRLGACGESALRVRMGVCDGVDDCAGADAGAREGGNEGADGVNEHGQRRGLRGLRR